jgi:hypothetical protein
MASSNKKQLVVARHHEDLAWLTDVPEAYDIVVYNKGHLVHGGIHRAFKPLLAFAGGWRGSRMPSTSSTPVLHVSQLADASGIVPASVQHRTRVLNLPNVGREADTYLRHIVQNYEGCLADVTVFCQGNPFEHSPDFLKLLRCEDEGHGGGSFRTPVQPLASKQVVLDDACKAINLASVHAHPISAHTLDAIRLYDPAVRQWHAAAHRVFGLSDGDNIIAKILDMAGASTAPHVSSVAFLCLGASFAVSRAAILQNSMACYEKLVEFNLKDPSVGHIIERCWLSLFGFEPNGDELPYRVPGFIGHFTTPTLPLQAPQVPAIITTTEASSQSPEKVVDEGTAPTALESTAPSALESTAPAALESTAPAALESTAQAALESTAQAALESTAQAALESTAQAALESTVTEAHCDTGNASGVPSEVHCEVQSELPTEACNAPKELNSEEVEVKEAPKGDHSEVHCEVRSELPSQAATVTAKASTCKGMAATSSSSQGSKKKYSKGNADRKSK